ncbi:hypothetical protein L1887_54483 [Cichorium endivia]|nr:hypothetical protein L1887_54483 [Cichorium endivia]
MDALAPGCSSAARLLDRPRQRFTRLQEQVGRGSAGTPEPAERRLENGSTAVLQLRVDYESSSAPRHAVVPPCRHLNLLHNIDKPAVKAIKLPRAPATSFIRGYLTAQPTSLDPASHFISPTTSSSLLRCDHPL